MINPTNADKNKTVIVPSASGHSTREGALTGWSADHKTAYVFFEYDDKGKWKRATEQVPMIAVRFKDESSPVHG
jgi:hypothetical protein